MLFLLGKEMGHSTPLNMSNCLLLEDERTIWPTGHCQLEI
jgi:hypothetical protein